MIILHMFTTLPPSPLVQIEHHRGFWGIRFNSMVMEAHGAIFFKEKGRAHSARTRARRQRGRGGGGGEGDVREEEEGMGSSNGGEQEVDEKGSDMRDSDRERERNTRKERKYLGAVIIRPGSNALTTYHSRFVMNRQ